ncbi:MAG: TolB family protein [Vicinamibacterales bacterium]
MNRPPGLALLAALATVAGAAVLAQVPVPPGTDIWLVPMPEGVGSLASTAPAPLAVRPGYDNQPSFSPDGARVYFTSSVDGAGTDAWEFTRATGRLRPLWDTPDSEYSPTPAPGGALSVIRVEADGTQRLWRYPLDGGEPRLILPDIKPVGYHAWVGDDHLALFVLGDPNSLQVARVSTGQGAVVARGVGRSLHRVPGTRLVSFIAEHDGAPWLSTVDVDSLTVTPLVQAVDGSQNHDYDWLPDGSGVLMSAGTRVHFWRRGQAAWTPAFDGASRGLGALSRLAVSPSGDAVAIVADEARGPR